MKIVCLLLFFVSVCHADCLKVGVLGEFSTTTSRTSYPYGQEIYRGLEIGKANSEKCYNLIKIDINNNIANIDALIRKHSREDRIKHFIGLGTSEQAHAALTAIDETNSILISPTATDDKLIEKSKNIILLSSPNSVLAEKLAEELKRRNLKKVAIIYGANNVYSQSMAKFFEDAVKKLSIDIIYKAPIRIGRSTKIDNVDLVKLKQADALFLPIFEHDVVKVLGHLYKNDSLVKVIGADSWGSDSKIVSTLPDYVKKYILFSLTAYDPKSTVVRENQFFKDYFSKFQSRPLDIAAFSFEALNLIDKKDMKKEYLGVTGKVKPLGQTVEREIFIKAL